MAKVTPHENLVPDTRDGWVKAHPFHDFINNQILAYKFIRAASYFFHLRKGKAIFSGYLMESKKGSFVINLWHQEEVIRRLVLHDFGYQGFLHAEIKGEVDEVVGWDLIGSLAMNSGCLTVTLYRNVS